MNDKNYYFAPTSPIEENKTKVVKSIKVKEIKESFYTVWQQVKK